MAGYPCCCNQRGNVCGECDGTAPLQYQLTVPTGLMRNNPDAFPQGCGEACEGYNGVFLLDYDPDLDPRIGLDVTCIWQSPDFEVCYECHGTFDTPEDEDPEPIVCTSMNWYWRIELTDEIEDDGFVSVYLMLLSVSGGYQYTWNGQFHLDCSAPLELTFNPFFLPFPAPGCIADPDGIITLEPAP